MTEDPASAGASPELERILRAGFAEGIRVHGGLSLAFDAFRDRALALAAARLTRWGAAADPGDLARVFERAALRDLFLAAACDAGVPGSWETFLRSYGPRIRVIALRQGADAGQAEAVAEEMGGALLLPPARGGARTRMGTYDGTAPLGAWLAGIVHHRLADLRRARRATSLDDLLRRAEEGAEAAAVPAADVGDPGQEAGDAESATAFGASIRRALDALTERERSALVARYGEGLSQEEIARRLGVGAPRVSRLLDSAREKVRAAVLSMPGGTPLPDGDRAWSALRDVLGSRLATSPPKHVSREGDSDSGA